MGCFPALRLLRACTAGSSSIKVMTVDGRCLRFPAPLLVKEALVDYPCHAIFLSDSVRSLGDRARPLHRTCSLLPGHIYFLVPHSATPMESSSTASSPSSSSAISRSPAQRKVSFACTSADSEEDTTAACAVPTARSNDVAACMVSLTKNAVELMPSPAEGVIRLKMVVSKKQLAALMRDGGDCIPMVEGLLSPLLQEAERAATAKISQASCNVSWRPSLKSIPESPRPNSVV